MKIGPNDHNRSAIRRWVGLSEAKTARVAGVTVGVLASWERTHTDWLAGYFRGQGREHAIIRLADTYAALLWMANGLRWPDHVDDEPLRAAMLRMRK